MVDLDKNNKPAKYNTDSSLKKLMILNTTMSGLVIIGMVIFVIISIKLGNRITYLENNGTFENTSTEDEIVVSLNFEEVTDQSVITNVTGAITNEITRLTSNNYYIPIVSPSNDGQTFAVTMYNSHGESIYSTTSNETTIYLNNNNSVFFGSTVSYGSDVDTIKQTLQASQMAAAGLGKFYKCDDYTLEDGSVISEYIIDIYGWTNIEIMYNMISEDLAQDYVPAFKTALESDLAGEDVDVDYTNLRFTFVFDENESLIGASSYYYFGEYSIGAWADCYSVWAFETVLEIDEWKLEDGWYDFDYLSLSEDNVDTLYDLLDNLNSEMNTMIEKIAEEQGLDLYTGNELENMYNSDSSSLADDNSLVDIDTTNTVDNSETTLINEDENYTLMYSVNGQIKTYEEIAPYILSIQDNSYVIYEPDTRENITANPVKIPVEGLSDTSEIVEGSIDAKDVSTDESSASSEYSTTED